MSDSIETPLVTVIIPSYNHAEYVEHAIRSVVEQTYRNLELLIIDDGSKDDSVVVINECLKQVNTSLAIQFISRENRGLCNTLNQAFEIASGTYALTLASDDILLKESVSLLVYAAKSDPSIVITSGYYVEIDSKNRYIPIFIQRFLSRNYYATYVSFEDRFTKAERFCGQASLYKRKEVLQVGGFRSDLWVEDYYMQLMLLDAGFKLYRIKHIILLYRIHETNSISATESLKNEVQKIKQIFSSRNDFKFLVDKANKLENDEHAEKIEFSRKWSGRRFKFRQLVKSLIKRKY